MKPLKSNVVVLIIVTLIFMGFILFVLPNVAAATKAATGSTQAPDTAFFYSAQSLYQIAGDYGPEGRSYYIRNRFTFDVIWPLVYGVFLATTLSVTFKKPMFKRNFSALKLLPIFAVAFDFLENVSTSFAMYTYPKTTFVAYLAPYFTATKWLLIYGAFGLLMAGLVIRGLAFIKDMVFKIIQKNKGV